MDRYPATQLSDMVDRLGPCAQSKYRLLEQRRDEVRALLKLQLETSKDIDTRHAVVAAAINSKDPADPALARLQQQLTQLDRESAALEKKHARLLAEHGNLDQVISRLQNALPGIYGAPDAPSVVAELKDGESLTDALLRTRHAIMTKQNELAMLHVAPWPASEIKVWLHGQIEQLRKDAPRIVTGQDGRPRLVAPDISEFAAPGSALVAPSGSTLRTLASVFPRELTQFLEAQIVDAPGAIAFAERPTRIAETEREILQLERIEEHFVTLAEAQGVEVHRRFGANPMAILGLATLQDIQQRLELQAAE